MPIQMLKSKVKFLRLKSIKGKFVFFDLKDAGGMVNCFMTVWQLRTPIEGRHESYCFGSSEGYAIWKI